MLTANKLEMIIEVENKLKARHQEQLDALAAEIAGHVADKNAFLQKDEEQKAVIATQLEQIKTLTSEATANKHTEQLKRELGNRSEKLQDEVTELKKYVKGLQKDLGKARDELKTLKQFDPAKMKKNLDANKKKRAESQAANNLLKKSLNTARAEKAEAERKVKELEAKLAELDVAENVDGMVTVESAESVAEESKEVAA